MFFFYSDSHKFGLRVYRERKIHMASLMQNCESSQNKIEPQLDGKDQGCDAKEESLLVLKVRLTLAQSTRSVCRSCILGSFKYSEPRLAMEKVNWAHVYVVGGL